MRTTSERVLFLGAILFSVVLLEVGIRVLWPNYFLRYSDAVFSERYHHASADFSRFLKRIEEDPGRFRGKKTIAFLGDSFVAGREVSAADRFTSILQSQFDRQDGGEKVVNLGYPSYTTMLYERLYHDVVLTLRPDIVVICLDETDAFDDYNYERDLDPSQSALPESERRFTATYLRHLQNYPVRFFLLRHSRIALLLNAVVRRINGSGLIPAGENRDVERIRTYISTTTNPATREDLFDRSEKFIASIASMRPTGQQLYFVTYPRAENLAGQRKTTLIHGALADGHSSVPFFQYWIEKKNLAAKYPQLHFVHTLDDFRQAIAKAPQQYYFFNDDVHWNQSGHRLFSAILISKFLGRL